MADENIQFSADSGNTVDEMDKVLRKMRELEQQAVANTTAFNNQNQVLQNYGSVLRSVGRQSNRNAGENTSSGSAGVRPGININRGIANTTVTGLLGRDMSGLLGLAGLAAFLQSLKMIKNETQALNDVLYKYASALKASGSALSSLDNKVVDSSNEYNRFKNSLDNMKNQAIKPLTGVLNDFYKFWNSANIDTSKLQIKDVGNDVIKITANKIAPMFEELAQKIATTISSLSVQLQNTGLSQNRSQIMASQVGTIAAIKAKQYGMSYDDSMKNLSSAVMGNGTEASTMGFNLSDRVLSGWLAKNKHIDLTNVKMTDAVKQAYKQQLLYEESTFKSNKDLAKMENQWGAIGDKIKAVSQNGLFPFEETISMSPTLFDIPDDTKDNFDKIKDDTKDAKKDIEDIKKIPAKPVIDNSNLKQGEAIVDGILDKLDTTVKTNWEIIPEFMMSNIPENSFEPGINTSGLVMSDPMYANNTQTGINTSGIVMSDPMYSNNKSANPVLNAISNGATTLQNGIYAFNDFLMGLGFGVEGGKGHNLTNKVLNYTQKNVLKDAALAFTIPITAGGSATVMQGSKLLEPVLPHADGCISLKEHIARISEGNNAEAVIPLKGNRANEVLSDAFGTAIAKVDGGAKIEYNINLGEKGVFLGTNQEFKKFVEKVIDESTRITKNTGSYTSGLKR